MLVDAEDDHIKLLLGNSRPGDAQSAGSLGSIVCKEAGVWGEHEQPVISTIALQPYCLLCIIAVARRGYVHK